MKAILYILAIAAIIASGYFSYETMELFKSKKAERQKLQSINTGLEANIKTTKKNAEDMEQERDDARKKFDNTEAAKNTMISNIKFAKRELGDWTNKIAAQKEKLDGFARTKAAIQKQFAEQFNGRQIELEEVPGLVKKLEDDLKAANRKVAELLTLNEEAEKNVAANNAKIGDFTVRMETRVERLTGNALEGTITSVNHDWGFAIVKVPGKMPVSDASKLIVKRGQKFIGYLIINAIEEGRIIADIDYKGMTAGMIVRPGDAVVLEKAVSR